MKIFRTPIYFPWFFPRRRWGFSSASNSVYLTFDDGPTPELTNWILEYLDKEDIKATFFCVGSNAKEYPELMERMTSAGHAIGNHTIGSRQTETVEWCPFEVAVAGPPAVEL